MMMSLEGSREIKGARKRLAAATKIFNVAKEEFEEAQRELAATEKRCEVINVDIDDDDDDDDDSQKRPRKKRLVSPQGSSNSDSSSSSSSSDSSR